MVTCDVIRVTLWETFWFDNSFPGIDVLRISDITDAARRSVDLPDNT